MEDMAGVVGQVFSVFRLSDRGDTRADEQLMTAARASSHSSLDFPQELIKQRQGGGQGQSRSRGSKRHPFGNRIFGQMSLL